MSKEFLSIEFYRNFVGIENPLNLSIMDCWGFETKYELKNISNNEIIQPYETLEFASVKPHLKLPEDLTDEEWRFIFGGDDIWYYITRTGNKIKNKFNNSIDNFFCLKNCYFNFCSQEMLDRMYSHHSHPKAKEYIEKGLAIKIEVNNG